MHDSEVRAVLKAYADQPGPGDLFPAVQQEVGRRRSRRRWVRGGVATLVLLFACLTFVPFGGTAAATARGEIVPTLFLKTNLAEAQRAARTPLALPESVPAYAGKTLPLGPDTPALVGRWLSYETVAVSVSEKDAGMGVLHFDLRRSTYRPASLIPPESQPAGQSTQAVKVGKYDGMVMLDRGRPLYVAWSTDTHFYRLLVGSAQTVDDLVKFAGQIQ